MPQDSSLSQFWQRSYSFNADADTRYAAPSIMHDVEIFIEHYWPHGHIIGWEHTFINEAFHILDAIVNDKEVGPYAASFEDGYKCNVVMEVIIEQAK